MSKFLFFQKHFLKTLCFLNTNPFPIDFYSNGCLRKMAKISYNSKEAPYKYNKPCKPKLITRTPRFCFSLVSCVFIVSVFVFLGQDGRGQEYQEEMEAMEEIIRGYEEGQGVRFFQFCHGCCGESSTKKFHGDQARMGCHSHPNRVSRLPGKWVSLILLVLNILWFILTKR